nr:unnamed protein product [Callosobruchus analis]
MVFYGKTEENRAEQLLIIQSTSEAKPLEAGKEKPKPQKTQPKESKAVQSEKKVTGEPVKQAKPKDPKASKAETEKQTKEDPGKQVRPEADTQANASFSKTVQKSVRTEIASTEQFESTSTTTSIKPVITDRTTVSETLTSEVVEDPHYKPLQKVEPLVQINKPRATEEVIPYVIKPPPELYPGSAIDKVFSVEKSGQKAVHQMFPHRRRMDGSVHSSTVFLLYVHCFADDSTLLSSMELGKPLLSPEIARRRHHHASQVNADIKRLLKGA